MTLNAILVEDSSTIRETLVPTMAELANTDVIAVAESATEAVDVLNRHAGQWDVVIVDMFLRQSSGFEVIEACEHRGASQKVIVLTNYATADMRRRCMAWGADAVFDKSTELDGFFELCISLGEARQ